MVHYYVDIQYWYMYNSGKRAADKLYNQRGEEIAGRAVHRAGHEQRHDLSEIKEPRLSHWNQRQGVGGVGDGQEGRALAGYIFLNL